MNRAFVGENDGWKRCRRKMEDCMFANDLGECVLERCRIYPEDPPFSPAEPEADKDK